MEKSPAWMEPDFDLYSSDLVFWRENEGIEKG